MKSNYKNIFGLPALTMGRKKINLQLFAEEDGSDDGKGGKENPPANKYSDDDYLKLKGNFDKAASELADLKKQLKAKQTDEEKKAEEEKAKQTEYENLKQELALMKVQAKLASVFSEDEIKGISQLIVEGDVEKLVDKLVEYRTAYKTKVYEDAKKEFSQSAGVPGGGSANGDKIPEVVQKFIDQKKGQNVNDAREYYFGKKQE